MGKSRRSFSLDEDLHDLMKDREDVNWSGVVEQFLREFVASGQGTEAALSVRAEQVRAELSDARAEVDRLERELERLEAALDEKRETRRDVFESFAALDATTDYTPANDAVKTHAAKLGMAPETFLAKYREWSG